MKDLLSIVAIPALILFISFSVGGIVYLANTYFPRSTTYWFEESHLVCKEVKAAGFDVKVVKTCYILDLIK